jgi:hypothetical protein
LVDTKCIRSRQIENKKKKVEVQIAYWRFVPLLHQRMWWKISVP